MRKVKVGRAAMATSLEGRFPFLAHRVIESSWRLPQHTKLRNGITKWILRQVLYRHAIERANGELGARINGWSRGPLRPWADDLLNEARLRHEGFFNPVPIRQECTELQSGQRNWQYQLWGVLMLQAWLGEKTRG